jgi:hypothetical protein
MQDSGGNDDNDDVGDFMTLCADVVITWNAGEMYFQRGFECAYILNLKHCNKYSGSF